jgi:hypothetical protein
LPVTHPEQCRTPWQALPQADFLTPGRAEVAPTAHEEFKHGVIVVPVPGRERIDSDSALSESSLHNLV